MRFFHLTGGVLLGLCCILFACTIIQSNDITSLSQLNNLNLNSIVIAQNLDSGSLTSTAILIDSVMNEPVKIDVNSTINGNVTKQVKINWPSVASNSKLKFKSGITSGIVIKNTYYQNGMPRASLVYENDQLKEAYTFFYNNNGQLTNFVSKIYTTPSPTLYSDTLIYNSSGVALGYVGSIVRKTSSSNTVTTIIFPYTTYGNSSNVGLGTGQGGGNNPTYQGYNYGFGNCLCGNNAGNSCSGCSISFGNGSSSNFIISPLQVGRLMNQLQIEDVKITSNSNCGGSGSPTSYDTYYFHPLMLMRGLFIHGDALLNIYSIDWWHPGHAINSSNFTMNETVTFNFNYGQ